MSNPFDIFNDDLDAPGPAGKPMPSVAKGEAGEGFVEVCPKCRGTGKFVSYSGRVMGNCFACKGKGKNVYKTSAADRAKAKSARVASFAQKLENFCVEHKDITDWFVRVIDQRPNNPFRFAVSLREACAKYGSLTDSQVAAARKCIADDAARAEARKAAAPTVDATKIETAFAVAREKAARPGQQGTFVKPLKLTHGDVTVHFKPGTPGSTWDGMLFAKTPDDRKLGYIKGGKFFRQFGCTAVEEAAVQELAANPQEGVLAYAKAWKACGICSRTLLNDVSIARGIGPICASKYGWVF